MDIYHRRPMEVEAVQLSWENWKEVTDWIGGRFHQGSKGTFLEWTAGGPAHIGSWIVKIGGVFRVLDDLTFHGLYDGPYIDVSVEILPAPPQVLVIEAPRA